MDSFLRIFPVWEVESVEMSADLCADAMFALYCSKDLGLNDWFDKKCGGTNKNKTKQKKRETLVWGAIWVTRR